MPKTITREYIEQIIECEYRRVLRNNSGCFLSNGTMGVALFMIWYGKNFNKANYIEDGLSIIGTKCTHLTANDTLDIHKGQVGIALGILWLSLSGGSTGDSTGSGSYTGYDVSKAVDYLEEHAYPTYNKGNVVIVLRLYEKH